MHSYRSLEAWKVAHRALVVTLRAIDKGNRPRIAFGSAAEAECLVLAAGEVGYLEQPVVKDLEVAFGDARRLVFGLMKGRRAKDPTPHALRPTS